MATVLLLQARPGCGMQARNGHWGPSPTGSWLAAGAAVCQGLLCAGREGRKELVAWSSEFCWEIEISSCRIHLVPWVVLQTPDALVVFVGITAAVALVPVCVPCSACWQSFSFNSLNSALSQRHPSLWCWNISWLRSDGSCLVLHLLQDTRGSFVTDATALPGALVWGL